MISSSDRNCEKIDPATLDFGAEKKCSCYTMRPCPKRLILRYALRAFAHSELIRFKSYHSSHSSLALRVLSSETKRVYLFEVSTLAGSVGAIAFV